MSSSLPPGTSFLDSIYTIISAVLIDFLILGALIATAFWFISNRFLLKRNMHSHAIDQTVEWLYAFDVHCNSFFPLFLLLYVLQFLISPFLLQKHIVATVASIALYVLAFG